MYAHEETADTALPTVSELAAFCSPVVDNLRYAMASTPEGALVLGALPQLLICNLSWGRCDGDVLHVTPSSFSGAPRLKRLELQGHAQLTLAPRCFSGLRLFYLFLGDCGLTEVPAALSEVGRTLLGLDLSYNTQLQIDRAGIDTLLALPRLQSVALQKRAWDEVEGDDIPAILASSLGFSPALWTVESMRHLLSFREEWQKLHTGAPVPELLI